MSNNLQKNISAGAILPEGAFTNEAIHDSFMSGLDKDIEIANFEQPVDLPSPPEGFGQEVGPRPGDRRAGQRGPVKVMPISQQNQQQKPPNLPQHLIDAGVTQMPSRAMEMRRRWIMSGRSGPMPAIHPFAHKIPAYIQDVNGNWRENKVRRR